jgi:hypothetical protein
MPFENLVFFGLDPLEKREDLDTFWCLYCNLFKDQWLDVDHEDGALWTLESLKVKTGYNTIGIGNNMLTHLVEIGDYEIQCLSCAEFKMIQETGQLEFDLTNTRQEKADWEQRNTSELKKLERKQVVQLSEWIDSNKQASQPAVAVVSQQLQDVSDHLPPLQKELATISKEISALASKFKSNT